MKVIYEFDAFEDRYALQIHQEANDMFNALFEITHNLRRQWKHSEKPPTEEEIFEAIHELTKDIKCLE